MLELDFFLTQRNETQIDKEMLNRKKKKSIF